MTRHDRILPRVGYSSYINVSNRIIPRANYHPPTLHTQKLYSGSHIKAVEADWCPICHHRDIGEREIDGRVLWHCNECSHEW